MARASLDIRFCTDANGKPLATVRNFPGLDADMTPEQLRSMAQELLDAAVRCERLAHGKA